MNLREEALINLQRAEKAIKAKHEKGASVDRVEYLLLSIAYSLIRLGDGE